MFKKIEIKDFRVFQNQSLDIGKHITILCGRNATGKSTILALLANSTELKIKYGKTYFGKQFRAHFEEILKGSIDYDVSGSNLLKITGEWDNNEVVKSFRIAWQNDKTRYRVIPKDYKAKEERKFTIPVIYLGLSRLYPIGEVNKSNVKNQKLSMHDQEDYSWFKDKYKNILSLPTHNINTVDIVKIDNISNNKAGVTTDNYDWKTASSGQDNIGQILFAILSFKKLKREMGNNYKGGLLLIDELDAALHPLAQIKLLELFLTESKDNNLQIVVTTHSQNIVRWAMNNINKNNGVLYWYFTNINRSIEIGNNYSLAQMLKELTGETSEWNDKIKVYTEDRITRMFFNSILSNCDEHRSKLELLDIKELPIGCNQLVTLIGYESDIFRNYLFVFDGDVDVQNEINEKLKTYDIQYILLPCTKKQLPEQEIYDYVYSAKEAYFEKNPYSNNEFKIETFEDYQSENEKKKSTDAKGYYKSWFYDFEKILTESRVMKYWCEDDANKGICEKFLQDFNSKFNALKRRNKIP